MFAPHSPYNSLKGGRPELNDLIKKTQTGTKYERGEAAKSINKYLIDNFWFRPVYRPAQHFFYNESVAVQNETEQAVPPICSHKPTGK